MTRTDVPHANGGRTRWMGAALGALGALGAVGIISATAGATNPKPDATESTNNDASPAITTQTVTLTREGDRIACYLARPASATPAPGLILVHEWWGLNDWVRRQADRFAEKGYVALAVDLYRGEAATDREHAHELMRGLTDERALADLKQAFRYLTLRRITPGGDQRVGGQVAGGGYEYTAGKPVGVIGWCMGGGLALKLAIDEPAVACTVVCYGRPVTDVEQLRRIRGPLLGIWGATDRGIDVGAFREALEKAGVKAVHHVYDGAGHAFLNENNERGYDREQAEKAWKGIDAFLERELKKSK